MPSDSSAPPVPGRLTAVPCVPFDLVATLNSGQVFHWEPFGQGYIGLAGGMPAYVEPTAEGLRVHAKDAAKVSHYFGLDHDLASIHATFPQDDAMRGALKFAGGMRVIRQPLWECTATFITSAMKQVPHIRQISRTLRQRYGEPVEFLGRTLYLYPTPGAIASAGEDALRDCKLGYRAKTLSGAAQAVADGTVDLEAIRSLDDDDAREALMRLPGVGEKVANCVLLFGYERVGAFPVDTWIARILREIYLKRKRKVNAARMRDFAREYFGPNGGYAQQYLFHHARSTWKRGKPADA